MSRFTKDDATDSGILTLEGELTIQRAAELREVMLEAMSQANRVELKMSSVTRVDLSFLQLLCALHNTMGQAGKTLAVRGALPGCYHEAVSSAGFQNCIGHDDNTGLWTGVQNNG